MAVAAQLDIIANATKGKKRRGADRRELKLRARGAPSSGDATDVVVRNLSATGLLIEAAADLRVGDTLEVDLPETPVRAAKVVWASENMFGCEFDRPLARSAISAAQLRSEPDAAPGQNSDPDQGETDAQQWGRKIQELRKAKGYTLVEFARLMKVSRPTVWSWEVGKSSPRAAKKRRIEEILKTDEATLPEDAEATSAEEVSTSGATTNLRSVVDEAKERIALVAGVSPDNVKLIIEV